MRKSDNTQYFLKKAGYLQGQRGKDKKEWQDILKIVQQYNRHLQSPSPRFSEDDLIHLFFNTDVSANNIKPNAQKKLSELEPEKEYFAKALSVFQSTFKVQQSNDSAHLPHTVIPPEPYDALISMVGFSPQPILYTILTLKPKFVYLLTTSESAKFNNICIGDYFQYVIDKFTADKPLNNRHVDSYPTRQIFKRIFNSTREDTSIRIKERIIVSSEDTTDVFRKTRNLVNDIRETQPDARIAIDISGGKKSMDASAFLSGAVESGIDVFYVDFEKFKKGRPIFGSEFLNRLDNPYAVYNIEEENLVTQFWIRQDYAQVAIVSEDILQDLNTKAELYGLEHEKNRMHQIHTAALCYMDWSEFNYEAALDHCDFDYYHKKHDSVLDLLAACAQKRRTHEGAIYLACDRWMRGVDKLHKDMDKAALYFEQVFEILSLFRFCDLMRRHKTKGGIFDIGPPESAQDLSDTAIETHHFPTTKLIKMLFGFEIKEGRYSEINNCPRGCKYIRWEKIPNNHLLEDPSGRLTCQKILDVKEVRNHLAHFKCFNNQQCQENLDKVKKLSKYANDFMKLMHNIYTNGKGEALDSIKAKLAFASIDDFVATLQDRRIKSFGHEGTI